MFKEEALEEAISYIGQSSHVYELYREDEDNHNDPDPVLLTKAQVCATMGLAWATLAQQLPEQLSKE